MDNCMLCSELESKKSFRDLKSYFKDSRVFAHNISLCVFPTLGCFIKGYILLATKKHYLSLFNCPDETLAEIEKAIRKINDAFIQKMNCGMVFFEHGTVNEYELSSASVSHLHIHFLPIDNSVWPILNKSYNFDYYMISNLWELESTINKKGISAYLLFGDYDSQLYLIDCSNERFPSQFFRKVMYEHYYGKTNDNEWDWKKYPYYNLMNETLEIFGGMRI